MIRKTKCLFAAATTFSRSSFISWNWSEFWRESWSWSVSEPGSGPWTNSWEKSRCWGRSF
jgi:hypothetical protein